MDDARSLNRKESRGFSFFTKLANKPPPPPPKDRFYLASSPSTVSLSARSFTSTTVNDAPYPAFSPAPPVPSLPVPPSPQHQYARYNSGRAVSPSPSHTTLATAPSSASSQTSSFKRGFFGLGGKKRSKGGKSPKTPLQDSLYPPSDPEEDGSISFPWNFEHHVHVDDSLSGLPPSWTNSLHEAGFSPDEVEAIRWRKQYAPSIINSERPATPQQYVLANPAPRFDSLRRRPSNGTTSGSSVSHANSDTPLPRPQMPYANPMMNASAPTVSTSANGYSSRDTDNEYFTNPPRPAPAPPIPAPLPRSLTQTSITSSPTTATTMSTPPMSHTSSNSVSTTASSIANGISNGNVIVNGLSNATSGGKPSTSPGGFMSAEDEKRALGSANATGYPGRPAPLTFRVTNDADPLSPPPAYGSPGRSGIAPTFDSVINVPPPPLTAASTLSIHAAYSTSQSSYSNLRQVVAVAVNDDGEEIGGESSRRASSSRLSVYGARPPKLRDDGDDDEEEDDEDRRRTIVAGPRLSALPPRLSFHQDDADDWSGGLLSAVLTPPTSPANFPGSTPLSGTFPVSAKSEVTLEDLQQESAESKNASSASNSTTTLDARAEEKRKLAPQRPLPSITLPDADEESAKVEVEDDPQPSNTPLWNQLMGMVSLSDSQIQGESPVASPSPSPFSPTFSLTSPPASPSPTGSPLSPGFAPSPRNSGGTGMLSESALAQHNDRRDSSEPDSSPPARGWAARLLVPTASGSGSGTGARDRDSNQSLFSDTSTASTVTGATVSMAQRVSVVVRAPTNVQLQSFAGAATASSNSNRHSNIPPPGPPPRTPPPQPPSPGVTGPSVSTSRQSLSPMSATFPSNAQSQTPSSFHGQRPLSQGSKSSARSSISSVSMGTMSDSSSPSLQQTLSISSSSNEDDHIRSPEPSHKALPNAIVRVRTQDRERPPMLISSSAGASPIEQAGQSLKWGGPPSIIAVQGPVDGEEEDDDEQNESEYDVVADVVDDWLQGGMESPMKSPTPGPRGSFIQYSDDEDEHVLPTSPQKSAPEMLVPPPPAAKQQKPSTPSKRPPALILQQPSPTTSLTISPQTPASTPAQRYRGWQYEVLAPILQHLDESVNPQTQYYDLVEIAEGDSGSVFSARVKDVPEATEGAVVAVKIIPILPKGNAKVEELRKELALVGSVRHENVLAMDGLYLDLVEDALWIRMEFMERSLADLIALVENGVVLHEKTIARFASDILQGLAHLRTVGIAHRDVRSDNLLLSVGGVLKLADFSNAVQLKGDSFRSDIVGVIYWQAPEMRRGPYDAMKVDVWSVGATVWEMAEATPPFVDIEDPRKIGDTLPTLSQPEIYSRSFHEFLRSCSQAASTRPDPADLLNTPFIKAACPRSDIIQVISQCRSIEEQGGDS